MPVVRLLLWVGAKAIKQRPSSGVMDQNKHHHRQDTFVRSKAVVQPAIASFQRLPLRMDTISPLRRGCGPCPFGCGDSEAERTMFVQHASARGAPVAGYAQAIKKACQLRREGFIVALVDGAQGVERRERARLHLPPPAQVQLVLHASAH